MKIKKINVDSFGAIRGYYADFSDSNFTLIYGDNEAGKSTLMEFIRSTMFPKKIGKYPTSKKNDSGTMVLEMEDGDERILTREGKKVTEKYDDPLPSEEFHMDAETYRSLFALDLEQLTNDKIISSGDFRKRFLTIPGGENVPEVSKGITSRMDALMTPKIFSESKIIGKHSAACNSLDKQIAEFNKNMDEYNNLAEERNRIQEELAEAKVRSEMSRSESNKEYMLSVMKKNLEEIEKMKAEKESLEWTFDLTDEDLRKYRDLKSKIKAMDAMILAGDLEDNIPTNTMPTSVAEQILTHSKEIEDAISKRGEIAKVDGETEYLQETIEKLKDAVNARCTSFGITEEEAMKIVSIPGIDDVLNYEDVSVSNFSGATFLRSKKRFVVVGAAAVVAAVGLFIPNLIVTAVGAVAAVGVAVAPLLIKDKEKTDARFEYWTSENGFAGMSKEDVRDKYIMATEIAEITTKINVTQEHIDEINSNISADKDTIHALAKSLGVEDSDDLMQVISDIYLIYTDAKVVIHSPSEFELMNKKKEHDVESLNQLIEKFGTEEKILEMIDGQKRSKDLDISIAAASKALDATANVTHNIATGEDHDITPAEDIETLMESLNQRLGEINNEMKSMVDNDELGKLQMKKSFEEKLLKDSALEWAKLSLSETIISECCVKFYSSLQPTVVKTANRYLALMTDDRYRLASDPRDSEICIEDKREKKDSSEWSSGLGDQVYLSIKMALTKELGSERLPFIMDDVLVRFDSHRKQGACRAIMEFAKDQQVIMFTCDSTLASLFKMEGNINYITLK